MSETRTITTPILQALKKMGILCFRMNSGKLRVRGGFVHMAKRGTADILCFPYITSTRRSNVLWIETKDPQGATAKEQREAQAAFKEEVEALGHTYLKAHSLDDVLAVL